MSADRYTAGIDSGSWNTKAALLDSRGAVVATAVVRTAADVAGAAERALNQVLREARVERDAVAAVWSTGFGRQAVPFATGHRTELDAHARGVLLEAQGPLTVVDIGGQDAKVIRLDAAGRRVAHKMNRKCAAGTGSFLEEIALRLDVRIDELSRLASSSTEEVDLASFCTVFAGTELLTAVRQGKRPADLARAAYRSVVRRVLEMERIDGNVVATGGVVAHHPLVPELMRQSLGVEVRVPARAQEMGAIGVALAARAELGEPVR